MNLSSARSLKTNLLSLSSGKSLGILAAAVAWKKKGRYFLLKIDGPRRLEALGAEAKGEQDALGFATRTHSERQRFDHSKSALAMSRASSGAVIYRTYQ
jgi:hypothetical protein